MSALPKRQRAFQIIAVILVVFFTAFIGRFGVGSLHRAPQWIFSGAKLKLLPLEDASAGAHYDRTGRAPLPLATVVRELREAWPDQSLAVVHGAALEVGTALLHRSDIEAGALVDGKFVPSTSARWHFNEQMTTAVNASTVLFADERTYVFRRK